MLVLGLVYAWSIFARPIGATYAGYAAYLPQVFQVSICSFCISALFGSKLYRKKSPRFALIFAAILLGSGFVLTALCASWGIGALFVFYGVVAASGIGIAYNAIVSVVNPWFPDKTGLCSGIMMMGFGISALVFGSLANAAFAKISWTTVFLIIAVIGVSFLLAFAFIVRVAPKDIASQLGLKGASVSIKESPTKNQYILTTRVFWLYATWVSLIIACGLTVIGSAAQQAETVGVDANFAALLVGLIGIMNAIGRISNGLIFDKFGLTRVMAITTTVALVTMSFIALAFSSATGGLSPVLFIIAAILMAFAYGSGPVMNAAFARQRFKVAEFSKNLGMTNCTLAAGALINIVIGLVLGPPYAGKGTTIFAILATLSAVALAIYLVFRRAYKRDLAKIAEELE